MYFTFGIIGGALLTHLAYSATFLDKQKTIETLRARAYFYEKKWRVMKHDYQQLRDEHRELIQKIKEDYTE